MPDIKSLVTENIDVWTSAIQRKSSAGRGSNNKIHLHGIQKLRDLILDLTVRGKLVPQDPNDEPASVLLEKIAAEKEGLVKEGKIKKQKPLPPISDDEKLFELPQSWEWVRLGGATNYGVTDKAEPSDVDAETWVLELEDVEKQTSKLLRKVNFKERQFKSSKNRFHNGGVLYGKLRPYLDKVLIADASGVCTTEMIPVRAYYGVSPEFLRLLMKTPDFVRYANDSTHGMNLPRLGTDKARLALLPLAPEVEQHRIVAKVDELMALCDQLEQQTEDSITAHQSLVETLLATLTETQDAKEFAQNWGRIAEHFDTLLTTEHSIDQLIQTILQLAVMGKLVPQDPNDEPASVLLEKIATEKAQLVKEGKIKKQKPLPEVADENLTLGMPEGWCWAFIPQVLKEHKYAIKRGPFGSAIRKDFFVHSGYKVYEQQHAISDDFSLGKYYIDENKFKELKAFEVLPNDLIISCSGTVGRVAVAPEWMEPGIINQALLKISLNATALTNDYF